MPRKSKLQSTAAGRLKRLQLRHRWERWQKQEWKRSRGWTRERHKRQQRHQLLEGFRRQRQQKWGDQRQWRHHRKGSGLDSLFGAGTDRERRGAQVHHQQRPGMQSESIYRQLTQDREQLQNLQNDDFAAADENNADVNSGWKRKTKTISTAAPSP